MAKKADVREQDVYYQKALSGDYSQFEKLEPERRDKLAQDYMTAFCARYPELERNALHSDEVLDLLRDQAMNPAFRLGCSLRSKEGMPDAKRYTDFDDYMNTYIMEHTLRPMDRYGLQSLKDQGLTGSHLDDAVGQNVEKQVMLAKTLFLTHLGEAKVRGAGNSPDAPEQEKLDRPVSSMMAHCSRTAYVFPPGDSAQQDKLFTSLLGPDMGKGADMYRRMAATHSVSSGPTINDFKEQKKFSMSNQYGMNIAIGGVGNPGISGPNGPQTLKSDGSCGHMYMHVDKGGTNKCGSLLIGFESDAPGVTNQQGHTHNAKATPESMSSFLGQRSDEMGDKYGGRIVDCTKIPIDKLERTVDAFTDRYRSMLIAGMADSSACADLEKVNKKLCADPMNKMDLAVMMCQMGMDKEKVVDTIKSIPDTFINENHLADIHSRSSAENLAKPPQKPGRFTRLKAAFGSAEAKKACQEHKDYQASLTGRAAERVDLNHMKASEKEHSLKQLNDNKSAWKAGTKKPVAYRDLYSKRSTVISTHREQYKQNQKLAEKNAGISSDIFQGISIIPPTQDQEASVVSPAHSEEISAAPPAHSEEADVVSPAKKEENVDISYDIFRGASIIPPKQNEDTPIVPLKRTDPSMVPFKDKPAAKPSPTKGDRRL